MHKDSPSSPYDLTGKVVVVTGGSLGIGESVARLVISRGGNAVIGDIREAEGRALAETLGDNAFFHRLDVGKEQDWRALVAAALDRFHRIDALVNCAGILIADEIAVFEREAFERVLRINLIGPALGIKHVAPAMIAAGGGSIVNMSSAEGFQGVNSMGAYASSKWGLRGLTRVAALELGDRGIRVNSVHPGPVNTAMANPRGLSAEELVFPSLFARMPIARVAEAGEIAELCGYLISDSSAFVTGAEIAIDGGMTAGNFVGERAAIRLT